MRWDIARCIEDTTVIYVLRFALAKKNERSVANTSFFLCPNLTCVGIKKNKRTQKQLFDNLCFWNWIRFVMCCVLVEVKNTPSPRLALSTNRRPSGSNSYVRAPRVSSVRPSQTRLHTFWIRHVRHSHHIRHRYKPTRASMHSYSQGEHMTQSTCSAVYIYEPHLQLNRSYRIRHRYTSMRAYDTEYISRGFTHESRPTSCFRIQLPISNLISDTTASIRQLNLSYDGKHTSP